MPDYAIRDVPGGFAERFEIAALAPFVPTAEQARLIEIVNHLVTSFAEETGEPGSRLLALRGPARTRLARALRDIVTLFVNDDMSVEQAIEGAMRVLGQWEETQQRTTEDIEALPFVVRALGTNGLPIGPRDLAHDLSITVRDRPVAQEKLRFKVEIDRTLMVIKVILPDVADPPAPAASPAVATTPTSGPRPCALRRFLDWMRDLRWNNFLVRCFGNAPSRRISMSVAARRSGYIRSLAGIARVGLETADSSLLTLATQSLDALREEIVAMEASNVKNRYLWRLGARCLIMALISLGGYLLVGSVCPIDHFKPLADRVCSSFQVPSAFRNFFLLAAGTAVGTWLSFSLRRVILTFLDLASLEDDRLDPTMRVLFVTALATVVGLLFWTEAVTVGIGKFNSNFAVSGTYALLIGLLLGIAERTMSTSVFKRATDFAGAVGGR
jgi:hypothetical protein